MAVSSRTAISEKYQAFGPGNWQLEKHFLRTHLPEQCQRADYLAFRWSDIIDSAPSSDMRYRGPCERP